MQTEKEKLSVYIPGKLKRQAKARAALEGESITTVVERFLSSYVCEEKKNAATEQVAA